MAALLNNLIDNVLDIVYYQTCASCGVKGKVICSSCEGSFKKIDYRSACPVCGRLTGKRLLCGECILNDRGFSEGYYGFVYENRLRDAVHTFKFNGRQEVGRYLVSLLRDIIAIISDKVDCIVPIPITEKRLNERGFNQSFIIAQEVSRLTGKPVFDKVIIKAKDTKDQYSLSKKERKNNIKGAFSLKKYHQIEGKRVLLVDDLFTTGFTAMEASKVINKAAPQAIVFFALARTP
ncbi:MAG TPA: ComF family protein [Syntrophorhabdaceae bacterium]|nr:ComF family protein [Syntrophorhabdaceae bacterium]